VNPVFDSRTIAEELRKTYGFKVDLVENATQAEVLKKIRDYAEKKYEPLDQLLIFFAGHGTYDQTFGEGFVGAVGADGADGAVGVLGPEGTLGADGALGASGATGGVGASSAKTARGVPIFPTKITSINVIDSILLSCFKFILIFINFYLIFFIFCGLV
jgi:hypothetical protein